MPDIDEARKNVNVNGNGNSEPSDKIEATNKVTPPRCDDRGQHAIPNFLKKKKSNFKKSN